MDLYERRVLRLREPVQRQERANPQVEVKEVLTSGLEGYTNKELKSMLDGKGIEHNSRATKAELIALLEG